MLNIIVEPEHLIGSAYSNSMSNDGKCPLLRAVNEQFEGNYYVTASSVWNLDTKTRYIIPDFWNHKFVEDAIKKANEGCKDIIKVTLK